jgi:hypothetical protein
MFAKLRFASLTCGRLLNQFQSSELAEKYF